MRAGWLVSLIGHIGAILMTTLAWQTAVELTPSAGSVVPVEIADVAEESNVRALAEDVPDDEVAPVEQEVQQQQTEPTPSPTPAPTPRREARNEGFDLDAAAGMVNTDTQPGRRREEGARANRNQRGAGLGTAEVASLEDRLRAVTDRHLQRCWRSTMDARDPSALVVTLRFALDRDGRISGDIQTVEPHESAFLSGEQRAAINNARRAARVCEPYPFPADPILGEHYDIWRVNSYRFGAQQ